MTGEKDQARVGDPESEIIQMDIIRLDIIQIDFV
jgi:hypothetical protein